MPAGRRLRMGLATVLGIARRGFFIPYRYAATVAPGGYPALEPLFAQAEPAFREVLAAIDRSAEPLGRIAASQDPTGARFDQDWFPRLDAAAAYAIVAAGRPRRIVEIGSGHSTRFMTAAIRDGGLVTAMTCIDPAPRAGIGTLPVHHVPRVFSPADLPLCEALEAGDVLFVDSSHVAMPGTDVDRIVLDVLPRLRPGVLVHVHDILLPDPYPAVWDWRGYNEQIVAGALLVGGGWDLVFASHWVATRLASAVTAGPLGAVPLRDGTLETSLWLRRR